MDPALLTHLQIDALREVAHIGCGAAANALSQLLGNRRVELAITRSQVVGRPELAQRLEVGSGPVLAVVVRLRGAAEGSMMLVFPEAEARAVAALLVGDAQPPPPGALSPLAESALMEVGNIVAAAWLNAVGRVTGLILLPSVPRLLQADAGGLAGLVTSQVARTERVLVLDAWMRASGGPGLGADGPTLDAHVLVVPEPHSLDTVLGALGV